LTGSFLESNHIISATGSAAKPSNPTTFIPKLRPVISQPKRFHYPKEPAGSILLFFDPECPFIYERHKRAT
jgi:hypothetical protein